MANKDFKVKNGIDIQAPLPVSMGGTGQTTTENTLNALLPSQAGNSSKVLSTDGTNTTWVAQAVAYQRGGTASRPASPTAGDLYYNTDTNIFEQYTSSGWFAIAAAPGSPTGVTATNQGSGRAFNNGQASVAFTASTSGGAPATFTITPSPTTSPATFTGSASPITVTGLASSTQYTYTATATSPYGTSAASSASAGVTATTVPQAPTIDSVTAGNAQAIINFTAGATGGSAITQYTITSSPSTTSQTTSSSPYTFTGLTNGTSYTFTATATNANGTSLSSSASLSITPTSAVEVMEPIEVITIGTSATSSITFSNIPSTYTHLQIRGIFKCNTANNDYINMRFNGDTGSNYNIHYLTGSGNGSVGSGGIANRTSLIGGYWHPNWPTPGATTFGSTIVDILEYKNVNMFKTVQTFSGTENNSSSSYQGLGINSGAWRNTSAISSITLIGAEGSNLLQHSQFALYGIKG